MQTEEVNAVGTQSSGQQQTPTKPTPTVSPKPTDTPQKKQLSPEELAAKRSQMLCTQYRYLGFCHRDKECRYSHDLAKVAEAKRTECPRGDKCWGAKKVIEHGKAAGVPLCVFLHEGKELAVKDMKKTVDEVQVDTLEMVKDHNPFKSTVEAWGPYDTAAETTCVLAQ